MAFGIEGQGNGRAADGHGQVLDLGAAVGVASQHERQHIVAGREVQVLRDRAGARAVHVDRIGACGGVPIGADQVDTAARDGPGAVDDAGGPVAGVVGLILTDLRATGEGAVRNQVVASCVGGAGQRQGGDGDRGLEIEHVQGPLMEQLVQIVSIETVAGRPRTWERPPIRDFVHGMPAGSRRSTSSQARTRR